MARAGAPSMMEAPVAGSGAPLAFSLFSLASKNNHDNAIREGIPMPDRQTPDLASIGEGGLAAAGAMRGTAPQTARAGAWLAALDDVAIFDLTPEGRVRTWSDAAERALLYTAEEVTGCQLARFHTPESVQSGEPARLLDTARTLGRAEERGWRVRRDGTAFYASVVIQAMTDADGGQDGFTVVYRDITIRYAAEERTREVEARHQQLLDTLHEQAVCELGLDGEIRVWNSGAAALFGYSAEEAVGRPVSLLYSRQDVASGHDLATLGEVRANGQWTGEARLQRQDGALVRCHIRQALLRDAGGCPVGILWTARDMSDMARLEELEGAGRRVQAFLAILAHELRNPLAPIRNAVDVIRLMPATDARTRHCAEIIGRQLQLLTRLVTDLMDVGRVTTGKLKVQPVPTMVNDIVTSAVEAIRPALEAAGQSFSLTLPAGPVFVNADAGRLGQVLLNLLSNATKYTPRGGAVSLHVATEGGNVITAISDSGQGIAPEALDRIFNLFAQEGDDGERGGLGIGLALARAVVEAHGGAIQASSGGLGRGSTFTVILPEVEMDGATVPRAAATDCTGLRILIVDDSADSADSMAELLTVLGHEARPAYSGTQALELVRGFAPDVVLLDLEMPDMNGFEVLAVLRPDPANTARVDGTDGTGTRIFALTGHGTSDDRKRTLAAGFDAHLVKPLSIDALCRALAGDGAE
ncbi:Aerobic respiration control sensor protein ArcB [compost metagenome]